MKRFKQIVFILTGIGLIFYFSLIFLSFQDISLIFDTKEVTKPYEVEKHTSTSYPYNKFCFNLYATLFVYLPTKRQRIQKFIATLSLNLRIPTQSFVVDQKVALSGLPIFYCRFDDGNIATNLAVCDGSFDSKALSKKVKILTSFKNINALLKNTSKRKCLYNYAITWKISTKHQCSKEYNQADISPLVDFYSKIMYNKSVPFFNHISWSLKLLSIVSKSSFNIVSLHDYSKESTNTFSILPVLPTSALPIVNLSLLSYFLNTNDRISKPGHVMISDPDHYSSSIASSLSTKREFKIYV